MKKVVIISLLFVAVLCFGAVKSGVYTSTGSNTVTIYYEKTSDCNDDVNSVVYSNFKGSLYEIQIDPNGSDTTVTVGIYYDPFEPNTTLTNHTLYTLKEFTISALSNYIYAIPISDDSSNPYGGPKLNGDIYIGIDGDTTTAATLDNVKVYLYGKVE